MADWIQVLFGMVSGVGQGMGVLDAGGDRQSERAVLGVNLGHPIVTKHCRALRRDITRCYGSELFFFRWRTQYDGDTPVMSRVTCCMMNLETR